MTIPFTDYRIGSGHDLPLIDLEYVELLVDAAGYRLPPPRALFQYTPGEYRIRADGEVYTAGYPSVVWLFTGLRVSGAAYLQTAFCGGGWSGKVTVYTRTVDRTFARYNAVMILPSPDEVEQRGGILARYPVRLTRLEAL